MSDVQLQIEINNVLVKFQLFETVKVKTLGLNVRFGIIEDFAYNDNQEVVIGIRWLSYVSNKKEDTQYIRWLSDESNKKEDIQYIHHTKVGKLNHIGSSI